MLVSKALGLGIALVTMLVIAGCGGGEPPQPYRDGATLFSCEEFDGERWVYLSSPGQQDERERAGVLWQELRELEPDESKEAFAAWLKDCAG